MSNNGRFWTGILVGAAAGAAISLLLGTETGKQVLADIKTAAEKALHNWKEAAGDAAQDGGATA